MRKFVFLTNWYSVILTFREPPYFSYSNASILATLYFSFGNFSEMQTSPADLVHYM